MRTFLTLFLTIAILLLGYVLYIFVSTGFFRKIENTPFGGERRINLPGVEDIEISYEDNFLIFSSDDRVSHREGNSKQGHLYFYQRKSGKDSLVQLTKDLNFEFYPHGIYMMRLDSANYRIWAINHPSDNHTIEIFEFRYGEFKHVATHSHDLIRSPNDIYATSADTYFFTNDHGTTSRLGLLAEDYMGLALSDVVYFDGRNYQIAAEGIAYANGIAGIKERNLLFVASPRAFLIKAYQMKENGGLEFIEDIACNTGVDNIEITPDGSMWIGAHPNLLRFTSYAGGKTETSPSELIRVKYRKKGDYDVGSFFVNDGELVSASTIAIPYQNKIYIGNVMDDHLSVITLETPSE
jgi:arylesterase/paraoxonase